MGGKGQRRREKNYQAAHGIAERLPPPPDLKEVDALPSKLRKLMELKNSTEPKPKLKDAASLKIKGGDAASQKIKGGPAGDKKTNGKAGDGTERRGSDKKQVEKTVWAKDSSSDGKKKRKRKWKEVKDLRFEELDAEATKLSKNARKKEYLEARKKKQKKAKKDDDVLDFPGREKIKFGDIVEAPPKLTFPKKSKAAFDASRERIRLQAIESYRDLRGWESRPGIQLPDLSEAPES